MASHIRVTGGKGRASLLDAPLLERVLSKLPAADLAAAQLCCCEWANLIQISVLWRRHYLEPEEAAGHAPGVDWRQRCLHQYAARRWREGHAATVASKQAHTAPITAMAALGKTLITAASDGSAALWRLAAATATRPTRYSLITTARLQHKMPVVAVALASESLAVCATAQQAFLWREDECIRSFKWQSPGPNIIQVACAETQLVVAYADGTACVFDLYSGSLQLILRVHKTRTTGLLLQELDNSWAIITGAAGEVACSSISTGACLWRLSTQSAAPVCALAMDAKARMLYALDHQGVLRAWRAAMSVDSINPRWERMTAGIGSSADHPCTRANSNGLSTPAAPSSMTLGACASDKRSLFLPAFGQQHTIASSCTGMCITSFPAATLQRTVPIPAVGRGTTVWQQQQQHARQQLGSQGAQSTVAALQLPPAAVGGAAATVIRGQRQEPQQRGAGTKGAHSSASCVCSNAAAGRSGGASAFGMTGSQKSVMPTAIKALVLTDTGCIVTGHADGLLRVSRLRI